MGKICFESTNYLENFVPTKFGKCIGKWRNSSRGEKKREVWVGYSNSAIYHVNYFAPVYKM